MALLGTLELLLWVTVPVWLVLIIIVFLRVRKSGKTVEAITNEIPRLIVMASSAAGTVTLTITVAIAILSPQILQDPTAALYTTGLLGAAISLWWTLAVFWREIKLVSGELPASPSSKIEPKQSTVVEPADELLPPLRNFIIRWEQYLQLGPKRLLRENREDVQNFAHSISSRLAELGSRYADLLGAGVLNQIHMISGELRQFAIAQLKTLGTEGLIDMEAHGAKAYEMARSLTLFFESKKK